MHTARAIILLGLALAAAPAVRAQTIDRHGAPAIACDANGDFVIVWHSRGQDGSDYGIIGQRFDRTGARRGTEFVVNTQTHDDQTAPAVCQDAASNFVVAWTDYRQGVTAQIFDNLGNRRGGEFEVSTDAESTAAASIDCSGDLGVALAWSQRGGDGDDDGVLGRYLSNAGSSPGPFVVNTYTSNAQVGASVAMLPAASFVVVWSSYEHDDDADGGVFGQRFTSVDTKVGTEFQVNTYTGNAQLAPAVATHGDGRFVVAWSSQQDGDPGFGVFGQRFDADGNPDGSEFHVNTETAGDQGASLGAGRVLDVATTGDDSFVVVWQSLSLTGTSQDGDGLGVFGQRFTGSPPAPAGAEFQVNSATAGNQAYAAVCAAPSGEFVVAWETRGGEQDGIFAQRFDASGAPAGSELRVNSDTARAAPSCPGDCDASGFVSVDELVRGVNIALERTAITQCPQFDTDATATVTVNELITGVRAALEGCEAFFATPTPEPTPTPRVEEERTRNPPNTATPP